MDNIDNGDREACVHTESDNVVPVSGLQLPSCPCVQIAHLEEQLRASSLPLKKCQTRLEGRTERVCHDLVRDAPQESLVSEVQHLTQTRTLLREKLAQALYVSCLACLY